MKLEVQKHRGFLPSSPVKLLPEPQSMREIDSKTDSNPTRQTAIHGNKSEQQKLAKQGERRREHNQGSGEERQKGRKSSTYVLRSYKNLCKSR